MDLYTKHYLHVLLILSPANDFTLISDQLTLSTWYDEFLSVNKTIYTITKINIHFFLNKWEPLLMILVL